jgi:thioredoxin
MKRFITILCLSCLVMTMSAQCNSKATADAAQNPTMQDQSTAQSQSEPQDVTPGKGKIVKISQKEFVNKVFDFNKPDAVYTGKKPIIVDCYAEWCGWCKKMDPALNELATEYADAVIFYRIDMDHAKDLGKAMQITGLPTLLLVKSGQKVKQVIGYQTKDELKAIIEQELLDQGTESAE